MKTKAILLAVLLSLSMAFTSCHKEDDLEPKSTDTTTYPVDQDDDTKNP